MLKYDYSKLGTQEQILSSIEKEGIVGLSQKYKIPYITLYYYLKRHIDRVCLKKSLEIASKRYYKAKTKPLISRHNLKESSLKQGLAIRNLRESLGINLTQAAKKFNISHQYLSELERGMKPLSPELISKIAQVFSESIDMSYVAGLFDRRCSITIFKNSKPKTQHHSPQAKGIIYIPKIIFTTPSKVLVELLLKVFGVGSTSLSVNKKTGYVVYSYLAYSDTATVVAEALLPYIRLRRKSLDCIIELSRFKSKISPIHRNTHEYYSECDRLIEKLKATKI